MMPKWTHERRHLLSNFFSLTALQGASYILPLLTLPYLVRVLGVEKFGLISFAQAVNTYFSIIVGYGFNLSATKSISVNRNDSEKVSEIFFSVMIIQGILLLISFLILVVMIFSFDRIRDDSWLFLSTFGMVVGGAFFPVWYFQGIENMKITSGLNIGIKLFFTLMVFLLVNGPGDFLYVPILNSFGYLAAAAVSLFLIWRSKAIKPVIPSIQILKNCFSDSTQFFLSRLANDGNQAFLPFVIGLFYGNSVLGNFSMVEKLYRAFYGLFSPILLTIYPYMAGSRDLSFFKKVFWAVVPLTIIVIFGLSINRDWVIRTIFGIENQLTSTIFLILFSGSIFGVISSLIGYPLLAAFGFIEEANYSLIVAALISFAYSVFAILAKLSIPALVASSVLYEVLACGFRIWGIHRRGIWKEL